MRSWPRPDVPTLPGSGRLPALHDTATGTRRETRVVDQAASLYVCGITPYDATHLGHAATYLAFDTLVRVWIDAGVDVTYAQNTTDVDDPLLERAAATGVDWRDLAASQTELFRDDMTHLGVIPPTHYVAVTDVVTDVARAVARLLDSGFAYRVPTADSDVDDVYFDVRVAERDTSWHLGLESRLDADAMMRFSAERGGDPGRPGKHDPLDPLLWRGRRADEPSWDSPIGAGRPGWHIECTVIAEQALTGPITVNGGGSDLVFPHHEMSAAHGAALSGETYADLYAHTGMVAYEGEKMSKSLGNLVKVSELVAAGHDARAVRLAVAAHHYRSDWEWFAADLERAEARLGTWLAWAASAARSEREEAPSGLVARLRGALSDDLDTPTAIAAVDAWITSGAASSSVDVDAVRALLGVDLRRA
ncbi:cysteine--1-D-myo-inosityl 2-amino-2-deoxy-alpha-D-glucopyranoside ligase [Frigoribacterium faeni]|uniref:L-cysteine:1D-myo-inositol 2-amino-2-deoxy-alpha-D-glucopyranoside ligase n=1 Tax=Frigoribacterium faeni TaxID=145483 RepID=A0A7W3JHK3_9MICO|nr:cysteine--1-D-myo-inosityl 2-amino-2-deoxy-alpha-D-glucopyranoside ligase [Frigoribacterium faeni]MBA8812948.1 L-cysteine:1D-myo-inositol 2-amino-2-deoxy-alpha-D-glucopyranoside ligase [Frigoribacterium faeni]GEK81988.1 L-cysteine:1D-myo-inositol 2-amino-2-deoxy-alpha-D-glucopyranoside ligase [Frigoribacterium faeni]